MLAIGASPSSTLVVTDRGIGVFTITDHTRATLTGLRALLAGFQVAPAVSPVTTGSVYNVTRGDDKVMSVVANDDGSVSVIRITSSRIGDVPRARHPWRVGGTIAAGTLERCMCALELDATDDVATCFKIGEHVAVEVDRPCAGVLDSPDQVKTLTGTTIARLVWQPAPWTDPALGGVM